MSQADRDRRRRRRRRKGIIVLPVEVNEYELAAALEASGFMAIEKATNRDALTAALQRVVDIFIKDATRGLSC